MTTKYEPRASFLAASPVDRVPLSFQQIEVILRRPLPKSARDHVAWWGNDKSHSHACLWMEAGWHTETKDLEAGLVVFLRVPNGAGKRSGAVR